MHKPTTTAKNTIDNTIELLLITLAMLFGTALSITSKGLLPSRCSYRCSSYY